MRRRARDFLPNLINTCNEPVKAVKQSTSFRRPRVLLRSYEVQYPDASQFQIIAWTAERGVSCAAAACRQDAAHAPPHQSTTVFVPMEGASSELLSSDLTDKVERAMSGLRQLLDSHQTSRPTAFGNLEAAMTRFQELNQTIAAVQELCHLLALSHQ